MENDDNTVESIRDDLDIYGGHLPVVIESHDGNLFAIAEIGTVLRNGGEVIVTISVGQKLAI